MPDVPRVICGKRGSDYGLFISQKDVDVSNTGLSTSLSFDSRSIRGLVISAKGEGTIAAPTGVDPPTFTTATISHGLGYIPLFAVRWCLPADLSSGVATVMYTPNDYHTEEESTDGETEESVWKEFLDQGVSVTANTSNLVITNQCAGESLKVEDDNGGAPSEFSNTGNSAIYYAYVIFKGKDTTDRCGL